MKTLLTVIVSGVVALAVAVGVIFYAAPASPSAGYTQSDVAKFEEGAQIGAAGQRYYAIDIATGTAQVSYRNTSGRGQYVPLLTLHTTGIASSTFTLTAGTSTSSTFNGFSLRANNKSLINQSISTSSAATTTSNLAAFQQTAVTTGGSPGLVYLADGEYVNIGLYQPYGTFCDGSTAKGACETATSTNRGFNVKGILEVLQLP